MIWDNLSRTGAGPGGVLSQGRGFPDGALKFLRLAGFDLGSLGLLESLTLRGLRVLYGVHRLLGGRLDHSRDPATQGQGERQCTKSHDHIIGHLRRTTSTFLES